MNKDEQGKLSIEVSSKGLYQHLITIYDPKDISIGIGTKKIYVYVFKNNEYISTKSIPSIWNGFEVEIIKMNPLVVDMTIKEKE